MTGADRTRPLFCAALAVALAFLWQFLAVRYNYNSNWTSLFCTGANLVQPPSLAEEEIYRFTGSYGYDGQFYHYVAHDPLFRHGLAQYVDAPRLRYRRILVPGLAWVAAAGQARSVDAAYIAVNLLFLFAGVYWLGRFVSLSQYSPAFGLLFLLVPAVVVSLDRLTVDLALTALCVGFALYVTENRPRMLYLVLALAPLARETGLLLTLAYAGDQLFDRHFRQAALYSTSALPTMAWYGFVQFHTTSYATVPWFTAIPFGGLANRILHPTPYSLTPLVAGLATALDYLALAGMLLAFLIAFWMLKAKWLRPVQLAIVLIALSGMNLGKPFWEEAYAFGRVFSPLLVLIALRACASRSWMTVLPLAWVIPRIGLQLGGEAVKIARGLFA